MKTISFEQLPNAIANLINQVGEIKTLLEQTKNSPKDKWMDLNELLEYDPEKRSKPTFYGYTRDPKSEFPFHKRGKRIIVLKSEFDLWLKSGKMKANSDLQNEVDQKLSG